MVFVNIRWYQHTERFVGPCIISVKIWGDTKYPGAKPQDDPNHEDKLNKTQIEFYLRVYFGHNLLNYTIRFNEVLTVKSIYLL